MPDNPATVAAQFVMRFRRQRPLRGGSLIVTIFGDSIMPRGGAITLGSLIRLAMPFGLNERLVRTAAARLAQDGWLESRRAGKLSEYHLSQSGRERFAEATARIYGDAAPAWAGRWTLIVLPVLRAAERLRLRKELAWHGFGELSGGVFAHPEVQRRELAAQLHALNLPANALVFDADLANDTAPSALVNLGWNLQELGLRYRQFVERFERAAAALRQRASPEAGFILRTLLIHEYRRLHLRDPLLPPPLLPKNWPGTRAAELCREIYAQVFTASETHLSDVAAQLKGGLPAPDRSVMQRFGGLQRVSPQATAPES